MVSNLKLAIRPKKDGRSSTSMITAANDPNVSTSQSSPVMLKSSIFKTSRINNHKKNALTKL